VYPYRSENKAQQNPNWSH